MKKILIVDDSAMNLKALKDMLESEYQVIPVLSGGTALSYLEDHVADLILLDIYMPEMDGIETWNQICKKKLCTNVPVVFLSASVDDVMRKQCEQMGAAAVIKKPFYGKQIKEIVVKLLGNEED